MQGDTTNNTTELNRSAHVKLAAAVADFPSFRKNKSGYGYQYLTLEKIVSTVNPILAKHKLFVRTKVGSNAEGVTCACYCIDLETGFVLEGDTAFFPVFQQAKMNLAQAFGSVITYARRYCLSAFLGIVIDEDDDGAKAGNPTSKPAVAVDLAKAEAAAKSGKWAEYFKGLSEQERMALIQSGKAAEFAGMARSPAVPAPSKEDDSNEFI